MEMKCEQCGAPMTEVMCHTCMKAMTCSAEGCSCADCGKQLGLDKLQCEECAAKPKV